MVRSVSVGTLLGRPCLRLDTAVRCFADTPGGHPSCQFCKTRFYSNTGGQLRRVAVVIVDASSAPHSSR